ALQERLSDRRIGAGHEPLGEAVTAVDERIHLPPLDKLRRLVNARPERIVATRITSRGAIAVVRAYRLRTVDSSSVEAALLQGRARVDVPLGDERNLLQRPEVAAVVLLRIDDVLRRHGLRAE